MNISSRHVSTRRYDKPSLTLEADVVIGSQLINTHYSCNVIWDTGAMRPMITQRVADALGLEPLKLSNVGGISGVELRPIFSVWISFAVDLKFMDLLVVGAEDLGGEHDALIGMNIIGQLDFAITNPGGNTTHSIRYPSVQEIDFEADC